MPKKRKKKVIGNPCSMIHITARITPEDEQHLEEIQNALEMDRSKVIRICIRYLYLDKKFMNLIP